MRDDLAIGDRRAIPALIDAVGRIPDRGAYGVPLIDPTLLEFMRKNQTGGEDREDRCPIRRQREGDRRA